RYRRVLTTEPQNAVALNNLAFVLAEQKHSPKEALPLADKAYSLSPVPTIGDTLGWIHHLLGNDRSARPLLEQAAAGARDNADVQLHAATVHAALGDFGKARTE